MTTPSSDDFEEVSIDGTSCSVDTSSTVVVVPLPPPSSFFACKACNLYFPKALMLRHHRRTVHNERKSLLEQLRERVVGYIRNSSGRYVCNYCDFGSFSKAKIGNHVTSEHGRKLRSVAVRTPSVTVAIETAVPCAEVEQEVIDYTHLPEKIEPKEEPKEEPKPEPETDAEDVLVVDMDQFEIIEEEHKVEPESEFEMLPDVMQHFEEVEDKIELEKEEVLEQDFTTMEPEAETEADLELVIEAEPEPEPEPEPELELLIEAQDDNYESHKMGQVQLVHEDNVAVILDPEVNDEIEIIAEPEVDPIQPDVDSDLPAGLEHGEEEMMIVTDDHGEDEIMIVTEVHGEEEMIVTDDPVSTVAIDEQQVVNEEDLHYVQEIEVTAEEAPGESHDDSDENQENSDKLQPSSGRWPNSMASLLPEELFRCKYCEYKASRRPTLYAHIRRKHRQLWLEATGRREDEHPLSQEQLAALGLAKRVFTCQHCDYAATTRGTLVSHMRNKHPDQEVPPVVRKPLLDLRCDMCDFRTRSRRKIEVHIERKHVTELRYTCEYCGKKFKVKCDLTSHIRFQHFKTPTICDVCGKICSNTNSLHVHQKREHFKPDFECHICGRRVVSQANLDEHIRRQHEERSKSMCEQCGKCFDQPNKLRQHIMTHTGERPHTCHVCKKSFARRAVFRQHFLIHTGERPYVCDICGKAFTQKPGLICHRKMHPGEKPPLPVVYIDHILKKFEKNDEDDEE